MAKPSMRDKMPAVAAFVDALREVFGREEIDAAIRRGLRSDCKPWERFHASESGHTLGQEYRPDPDKTVSTADMQLGPVFHVEKKGRR
jgi:hypothetical protein